MRLTVPGTADNEWVQQTWISDTLSRVVMLLRRLLGNNGRWLAGVELGVASIMSHMSESVIFVNGEAAVGTCTMTTVRCARDPTKGGFAFLERGAIRPPEACCFREKLKGRSFYSSLTLAKRGISRRLPRGNFQALQSGTRPTPQADDPNPPLRMTGRVLSLSKACSSLL